MPTKEEILNKHEENYDDYLKDSTDYGVNPIQSAMEEYAKQEALAYSYWERNHSWECDYREERSLSHDEYWEAYQKSKSN